MKNLDVNTTSITIGSIMLLVGIVLAVIAHFKNHNKDLQMKASDYTSLKSLVATHERTISDLRSDHKDLEKELRLEFKRFDEMLIKKVDGLNRKVDDLKDLLIQNLKK